MREAASKIVSRDTLRQKLTEHKRRGQHVVLANGCFDTLHVGHVRYLEGARREGDILVVGVNADSTVLVIKAFSTSRHHAREAVTHLRNANVRLGGVVLNDVGLGRRSRYASYYSAYNGYHSNRNAG